MPQPRRPKSQLDEVMTFGAHLEALRWHLIRALVGLAICLTICLVFGQRLLLFLLGPLRQALDAHQAGEIVAPTPLAGITAFFQISVVGGLVLASPWVVYQLWGFVCPGLYPHEKRLVYRCVPCLVVLFIAGAVFGWCVALPTSLDFMIRFNQGAGLQHQIAVSSWATFAVVFPLAFGLAFELPLGMVLLSRIGVVRGPAFRKHRKAAILIAAILSAVLTPSPNPVDMILMLIPLVLLYEGGIWCIWLLDRRRQHGHSEAEHDSNDLIASFLLPLLTGRVCAGRDGANRLRPLLGR